MHVEQHPGGRNEEPQLPFAGRRAFPIRSITGSVTARERLLFGIFRRHRWGSYTPTYSRRTDDMAAIQVSYVAVCADVQYWLVVGWSTICLE